MVALVKHNRKCITGVKIFEFTVLQALFGHYY